MYLRKIQGGLEECWVLQSVVDPYFCDRILPLMLVNGQAIKTHDRNDFVSTYQQTEDARINGPSTE